MSQEFKNSVEGRGEALPVSNDEVIKVIEGYEKQGVGQEIEKIRQGIHSGEAPSDGTGSAILADLERYGKEQGLMAEMQEVRGQIKRENAVPGLESYEQYLSNLETENPDSAAWLKSTLDNIKNYKFGERKKWKLFALSLAEEVQKLLEIAGVENTPLGRGLASGPVEGKLGLERLTRLLENNIHQLQNELQNNNRTYYNDYFITSELKEKIAKLKQSYNF